MSEATIAAKPLWLRILQFPVIRIAALGGIIFFMMMLNNSFMLVFKQTPLVSILVTLGMGLAAMAVYAGWARFVERRAVSELSLAGAGREWAMGAAIGAGLITACVLALAALGMYRVEGLNSLIFLLPAVSMALSSGTFEELFFRGVLFRSIEDLFGSWIAVAASALLFGLVHLLNPAGTLAGAVYISIEAGLLLAAAYLITRRLWIGIGLHMAWNYTLSGIFSGIVSGGDSDPGLIKAVITGPDVLTGGAFGLESSVFALVFCTSAGVILMAIAVRRGHVAAGRWR
ncbi:membrane protease YdiL (CAAX protease family) [Rhizobium sp. SG_E_25_P2]|uniref:CPBP family intramembrane glutamic endopeptidase n=1 Tax=Rhizobium sp. SG_E_25_P2 TaxID=2879942 RepID=UPI00247363F8|nr:type II CAAX endopeptidase family protein [Rhizobium sp. SG_E_25_P2]MDH6269152.1 membrane protease YdiL (CAAX protease family) [Rhizobium sp. SG_E_25_P2]